MQGRPFDLGVLALGICAVSTAAIFIREADAPSLVIAAYRLGLASLPLLLIAAARRQLRFSNRTHLALCALAGACMAAHFGFWIASLKTTSVITSVALVASQPLFVAVLSGPLLREPPSRGIWLGLALATAGALVMVAEDFGEGRETLKGDLFAVLGAMFAAAYILTGRFVRTGGAGWSSYVTVAYSVAAVLLVLGVLVDGSSFTGYSTRTYVFFLLLALVPQLIGHTVLNRSLGYLPAVTVAIAILGEPVGATVLAALFLGEDPSAVEVAGGFLLLAGVYLGVRASVDTPREVPVDTDL
jgi:drug/metabolite transporter (DMT)-like permease